MAIYIIKVYSKRFIELPVFQMIILDDSNETSSTKPFRKPNIKTLTNDLNWILVGRDEFFFFHIVNFALTLKIIHRPAATLSRMRFSWLCSKRNIRGKKWIFMIIAYQFDLLPISAWITTPMNDTLAIVTYLKKRKLEK